MGLDLTNPLVQIKITSSTCSFVAIAMTLFRLWVRRGRFWYDDGWAFFSLLALFVQIASVFMHVPNPDELSKVNRVASYYILATSFYAVIWSARLSILFSVIRLEPNVSSRKKLYWAALALFLTVVFLIAQLFWVCEPEPHWKDLASPQCTLNKQVAICQLVTDILSDGLLVFAPLRMIRFVANKGLRRRLMFIFSTSVVTTIVSLVHAAYILSEGGPKVLVAAIVEDTVSLMVANLPVAATAAMRAAGVKVTEQDAVPTGKLSTIKFGKRTFLGWVSGAGTRGAPGASSFGSTTLAGATTYKPDEDVERDVALAGRTTTTFKLDDLRSTGTVDLDEPRDDKPHVQFSHTPHSDADVDDRRKPAADDVFTQPV
ncbi:hypothetical protein AURDEDRAFT_117041 [Auricularia subglabra TFB-10046 SS5]|nr:hypothetical protein AURDEDRAFT_117041 [Auricularia subglabra TFB-10046 SS5]